jgi:hypothetical protein
MLIVLSPAKSLDFTPAPEVEPSRPRFSKDIRELSEVTRTLSRGDLARLMSISDDLAALNQGRFQSFRPAARTGVPAALAFNGDVYQGLQARTLGAEALAWAQDRVRILSGLYGLLRPLDLIQPYRLEMGTALQNPRGANLYDFWGDRISRQLTADAKGMADRTLVNLASQEYFGAVDIRALKLPVVHVQFREEKGGESRVLGFFAKKARGLMARYAIDHRIDKAEGLKAFDVTGYRFRPDQSSGNEWVFARPQPDPKKA